MRLVRWLALGILLIVLAGVVLVRPGRTRMSAGIIPVGRGPGAIAVDGRTGHAFVTNFLDDTVTMFDTISGAVLRTVAVGHAPSAVAVDARTSRAFVLNHGDNSVSMLDATTGTVLRIAYVANSVALAVDERTGHVFVASNSNLTLPGMMTMLDARSGTLLHRAPVGGSLGLVLQGITIDSRARRVLLTNCEDNTLSVLDTVSGRVVGTRPVGRCPAGVAVDGRTRHAFVINQADSTVSMLDAHSGAVLGMGILPVRQHSTDLAVDERTGHVFVFSLSNPHGTLSVLYDKGVSVLDARSGALLGTDTITAADPHAYVMGLYGLAVAAHRGRVFVLVGSSPTLDGAVTLGSVSVLDARSGQMRRAVAVGGVPAAMAVDETTGHLFVVTQTLDPAKGSGQSAWGWVPSWLRQRLPWLNQSSSSSANGSVTVLDLSHL